LYGNVTIVFNSLKYMYGKKLSKNDLLQLFCVLLLSLGRLGAVSK